MLFTAYAIVRTVPSANRPNRKEKKAYAADRTPSPTYVCLPSGLYKVVLFPLVLADSH